MKWSYNSPPHHTQLGQASSEEQERVRVSVVETEAVRSLFEWFDVPAGDGWDKGQGKGKGEAGASKPWDMLTSSILRVIGPERKT